MLLKIRKYLSESEIKKTNSLKFKTHCGNDIDIVYNEDLIIMIMMMLIIMMINIKKLEALEDYLKVLIEIITIQ